jgi:hypothetical protein
MHIQKIEIDNSKEAFLKNEFLTMSVLGALGRSKTYSKSVSEQDKSLFRIALREKLREIGDKYISPIPEEEHLSNIKKIADGLTSNFSHCLKNRRFRIGIAQKALNLYLKYLWCVGLIPMPPHCPFDSIIIGHLPECKDLNWTANDSINDYQKLVNAARKKTDGKPIAEWELEIWLKSVQSNRERKSVKWSGAEKGQKVPLMEPSHPNILRKEGNAMIEGTVTRQDKYADGKDICELYISAYSSDRLPHEYGKRKPIDIRIGDFIYEAGVHETKNGVVWISSVLFKKGPIREKARLVDALSKINVKKGDKIRIKLNEDGSYSLEKYNIT